MVGCLSEKRMGGGGRPPQHTPIRRTDRLTRTLGILAALALAAIAASAVPTLHAASGSYVIADTWPVGQVGLPADAWPAAAGVAIDHARRIYVADGSTARISVIEPDGMVRLLHPPGADPGLVDPRDLAVDDARQRLYVADPGARAIVVFGLDGVRQAAWGGLAGLAGVGVGPDGTVFAGDADTGEVRRFDPAGSPLASWRAVRGDPGATGLIRNIDVAADGTLAVLDGLVQRMLLFDARGLRLDPLNLPFAANDVVADHNIGIFTRRWYWFTSDAGLRFYDPAKDQWSGNAIGRLTALAVYGPVGIVAAEPGESRQPSRIHRFTYGVDAVAGPPAQSWGGPIDRAGVLDGPSVVQVAADGQVYVLDRSPRVQWFTPAGGGARQFSVEAPGAVDAGPDGTIFVGEGNIGGGARLSAFAPGAAPRWQVAVGADASASLAGIAFDAATGQVVALDAAAGLLRRYSAAGAPAGTVALPVDPAGRSVWADLAADTAGNLFALDRFLATVTVVAPDGGRRSVSVATSARRIAVRSDGTLLVLGRDGWVRGYDAGGALVLAFDARRADLAAGTLAADLSVDAAGDVFVADAAANVITRFRWNPDASPGRPPESLGACESVPGKTAAPGAVVLGETVEVRLEVRGSCGAQVATVPLDVILIIDRSGSMAGEQIRLAREAAMDFVAAADLAVSRVGVVAFNESARVEAPLSSDENQLRRALAGLVARGGTRIDLALAAASLELRRRGRPEATAVFILLSDGGSDPTSALQQADLAKNAGVEIFTINLQGNAALLEDIASGADHYLESASARDLAGIFGRIADRIVASALFRTLDVVDQIPANMRLVPGSADPPAVLDPATNTLRWHVEGVPFAGIELRYRLQPLEAGDWPTNVFAWATYLDGYGKAGRLDFPVPRVYIAAPTATPTVPPPPSATPRATVTATPTRTARPTATRTPRPRGPLYLPLALRETCRPGQRHADVMLVLDSSNSMAGANLAAAKAAAGRLIGQLVLPADQVGLVTFNLDAQLASRLTGDRTQIGAALAGLEATSPGTRIDRGLARARLELLGSRSRPSSTPVIVLLTDGVQNDAPETALRAAEETRRSRIQIYTIGLGGQVDATFLQALAGDPARAYLAPSPADLAGIYAQVAGAIPCPVSAYWGGRR